MRNINISNKQKPVTLKVNGIEVGKINLVGTNATKFQVMRYKANMIAKRVLYTGAVTVSIAWLVVGALHIGMANAKTTSVKVEVVKEVRIKAPVMDRIAKCESGGRHTDSTGQVVLRGNTNKTVDVGLYQINSVWYKKATELGLDITKESDNEAMAYWIYENRGTGDWYSSEKCWKL